MSDSRLILGIDTAGPRCAVGLAEAGGRLLAARDPEIGRGHAERLMDLVATVLGEAGATYGDLSRVAVSVGPGSFTGLRVGVAAARGLALTLGIPAVGVSTLEALAGPLRESGPVLAAIDAKRGEVYLAGYGRAGAVLREPVAVPIVDLPAHLRGFEPALLVGSGAAIVANALDWRDHRIENAENRVDLAALARIGGRCDPTVPPRPLYLRGADAKPQRQRFLNVDPQNGSA